MKAYFPLQLEINVKYNEDFHNKVLIRESSQCKSRNTEITQSVTSLQIQPTANYGQVILGYLTCLQVNNSKDLSSRAKVF